MSRADTVLKSRAVPLTTLFRYWQYIDEVFVQTYTWYHQTSTLVSADIIKYKIKKPERLASQSSSCSDGRYDVETKSNKLKMSRVEDQQDAAGFGIWYLGSCKV